MSQYRENHGAAPPSPGFDFDMGNSASRYQAATPNHNKLTKPRPNDHSDSHAKRSSSTRSIESGLHTNYDSLNDAEARHALRRSLTSTFPESQLTASPDSKIGVDLSNFTASYKRSTASFEVGSNHSAKSSIDSTQNTNNISNSRANQLAPVQENQPIDVEAAINLLQQLKKNASPEELVALHKALLPTRNVEPSPNTNPDELSSQLPPFDRGRTALVPGLATRGFSGDDVLRRPSEVSETSQQHANGASGWGQPTSNYSHKRPSPLDLRPEEPQAVSPAGSKRSSASLTHAGAYRTGTLRVTNGAASPAPSSQERAVSPLAPEQRGDDGYFSGSDGGPGEDFKPSPIIDHFPLPAYDRSMQPAPRRDRHSTYTNLMPPARRQSPSPAPSAQGLSRMHPQSIAAMSQASDGEQVHGQEQEMPRPDRISSKRDTAASVISSSSPDHPDNYDLTTPFGEIPDLPSFSARVSGETHEDGPVEGSRADAFRILNGTDRKGMAQSPYLDTRPAAVSKADSGYSSDSSLNRKASGMANSSSIRTPSGSTLDDSSAGQRGSTAMTTLQEALKTPPTVQPSRKSSVSTFASKGKKRMTLLRSLTTKSSSTPTLNDVSGIGSSEDLRQPSSSRHTVTASSMTKESSKPTKATTPSKPRKSLYERFTGSKSVPDLTVLRSATPQDSRDSKLRPSMQAGEDTPAASPATTPTKGFFSFGSRESSRARKRSSTILTKPEEPESPPNEQHKASTGSDTVQSRGRSKSIKRRSLSFFLGGNDDQKAQNSTSTEPSDGNDTGVGPVDLPTTQTKRRSQVLGTKDVPKLNSGLFKSKSYTGMSEEMAAQLARMKSKDRAGPDLVPEFDQPRIAQPAKKIDKRSQSQTRVPDRRVEDFIPGWQSVERTPQQRQKPSMAHRPYSTNFEAIPPMPVMPADAQKRALMADKLVADKMGTSPRATPEPMSRRSSADHKPQDRVISPRPSRSSMRKHTDEPLKERPQRQSQQSLQSDSESKPKAGWKTVRDPAAFEQKVKGLNAEIRASPLHSPTGSLRGGSVDGRTSRLGSVSEQIKQDAWEGHAQSWQERRKTASDRALASTLLDTQAGAQEQHPRSPSKSPSIVVSRYITPQGAALGPLNPADRPTDRARQHADLYMSLLHAKDSDEMPATTSPSRNDSAVLTLSKRIEDEATHHQQQQGYGMPPTDRPRSRSPIKQHDRSNHGSVAAWVTTTAPPSPGQLPQPDQQWYPDPNEDPHHARPDSASRLNGPFQDDDFDLFELEIPPSLNVFDHPQARQQQQRTGSPTEKRVPGRYDGGLGYGWDKESRGFIGSAGTTSNGEGSPKKSVKMSEDWGLDLSDVPVFLRKL